MFCCSSTICHSTHSLNVTVTLSLYLPLLLYNLFVAPMLFSCANTFILHHYLTLPLPLSLSLTFSSSRSLSLSLLFHHLHLTLSSYFSLFRYPNYVSDLPSLSGLRLHYLDEGRRPSVPSPSRPEGHVNPRSEEHTSELQSRP